MKYKVQIHSISGVKELAFDSETDLYYYVRKADYINHAGEKGNHILEATMTNPNDSLRHKKLYDGSRRRDRRSFEVHKCNRKLRDRSDKYHRMLHNRFAHMYYCLGYLVKDENGRTIDLRNYERELYSFDYVGYDNLRRKKCRIEYLERWNAIEKENDKEKTLLIGDKILYFRRMRTTQERRCVCDKENKPFIRGKRRQLPDSWCAEKPICREKTWKARTKVKQQWQVNIPLHIDTVWHEKRVYDEELFPECEIVMVLSSDDM